MQALRVWEALERTLRAYKGLPMTNSTIAQIKYHVRQVMAALENSGILPSRGGPEFEVSMDADSLAIRLIPINDAACLLAGEMVSSRQFMNLLQRLDISDS